MKIVRNTLWLAMIGNFYGSLQLLVPCLNEVKEGYKVNKKKKDACGILWYGKQSL